MTAAGADHFLDLERHRQQLEDNVAKLQKALQHWRMCDAEYEELKEEVEGLKEAPEAERSLLMDQIGQAQREVVTPTELAQLLNKNGTISFDSIANTLQHRIDYVTKNIETLEKQLEAAEHKLSVATVVMDPNVSNEEGLPFTDIVEELDEDGNVVSSHLQKPGDLHPQMMEALAKVGIQEKDVPSAGEGTAAPDDTETGDEATNVKKEDADTRSTELMARKSVPATEKEQVVESEPRPVKSVKPAPPKRSVSFAEDTKPGHGEVATDVVPPISKNAQIMEDLMEQARLQAMPASEPVIPDNESPEDAEIRREMLRYGMTDIAPIVAELEIDEGESEYEDTGSEWDDDDEDAYDEDGRYKYRVVDDTIHTRMRELQEKLGFKSTRELMEADSRLELEEEDTDSNKLMDGGIGRIVVKGEPTVKAPVKSALKIDDKATEDSSAKKGVKFATTLDVAPDPTPDNVTAPAEPEPTFVDPMRSTIVERAPAPVSAAPVTDAPKKVSRFKKTKIANTTPTAALPIRQATAATPAGPFNAPARFFDANTEVRTVPEGPEGKTLADAVVERDLPDGAKAPDDLDAGLLHQEAAVEYNRVRNKMIQKDGGFMKRKDAEIEYPDDVDEGGKKLSRFKAARLARQ